VEYEKKPIVEEFAAQFKPLECEQGSLLPLTDKRTIASFVECHIKGSTLASLGTIDVPLDPNEQAQYRANREILANNPGFLRMRDDAKQGRSFSNIVAEYTKEFDETHPLKIVGGQHRFKAIQDALASGVDEYHGIKVYFNLDKAQRLDVQVISNTNIAISRDLFDRMQETFRGPQLRNWCQKATLLPAGKDFADKSERGSLISVRMARSFISNYFGGRDVDLAKFAVTTTTPLVSPTGEHDSDWDDLQAKHSDLWEDADLLEAAREFAQLVTAQRNAFRNTGGPNGKSRKHVRRDYPEKAMNLAVLTAWAYVAGVLQPNKKRLKRHYDLKNSPDRDPLNAEQLAKGRHRTDDAPNYRGLGYRTDARERGRMVELFYLQAENGEGITPKLIKIAIADYHAKQAALAAIQERAS